MYKSLFIITLIFEKLRDRHILTKLYYSISMLSSSRTQILESITTTQDSISILAKLHTQTSEHLRSHWRKYHWCIREFSNSKHEKLRDTHEECGIHSYIYLKSLVETKTLRISVSTAMAKHLWSGSFVWISFVAPLGLAALLLASEKYTEIDIMRKVLVLHFSKKFQISERNISKLGMMGL